MMSDTLAMNINIRPATVDDLPACAKIMNNWIDETEWLPRIFSHEDICEMFKSSLLKKRTMLVADIDDKIGGYLTIDNSSTIKAIFLAPFCRCTGVGKALLDKAKQKEPNGLELGVHEPNIHALRFYKREGFKEIPEGRKDDTEEGLSELLMRWDGGQAQ